MWDIQSQTWDIQYLESCVVLLIYVLSIREHFLSPGIIYFFPISQVTPTWPNWNMLCWAEFIVDTLSSHTCDFRPNHTI